MENRWVRRAITIPGYMLAFGIFLVLLPVLLPLAALFDLVRGTNWALCRFLLMWLVYFVFEMGGLLATLWILPRYRDPKRRVRRFHELQWWWAGGLFAWAERIFSLRIELENPEVAATGPFLLLVRHASIADTVIPARYVSALHRIELRYVVKRELLWDPCLDVVGHHLPIAFVRRGSGDAATEIAAVHQLAQGLGPEEGVLIFPEGTRFSRKKQAQILAKLAANGPPSVEARARALQRVLPPRLGGILGLLDNDSKADIVFCGHTGFEGVRRLSDLWNGVLVNRRIRITFWRVPAASVPLDRDARIEWLFDQWQRLDQWVIQNQEPS